MSFQICFRHSFKKFLNFYNLFFKISKDMNSRFSWRGLQFPFVTSDSRYVCLSFVIRDCFLVLTKFQKMWGYESERNRLFLNLTCNKKGKTFSSDRHHWICSSFLYSPLSHCRRRANYRIFDFFVFASIFYTPNLLKFWKLTITVNLPPWLLKTGETKSLSKVSSWVFLR